MQSDNNDMTVLIADDETLICKLAQAVLARYGYSTLIACDGQQALEASRNYLGSIQLVLSGVQMPGLNGPELCEQIRQERQGIICVLMSGNVSGASMGEEMAFVEKPFTSDTLRCKVREVLQQRGHQDGAGAAESTPAHRKTTRLGTMTRSAGC